MVSFKQKNSDIGTIRKGITAHVFWEFDGNPDDIVYIQPGCGCTANCRVDGNTVVATYTENESYNDKQFPSGEYPVSKNITVFLNDGLDLKINTPQGLVFNPQKSKEVITFSGKVSLRE